MDQLDQNAEKCSLLNQHNKIKEQITKAQKHQRLKISSIYP